MSKWKVGVMVDSLRLPLDEGTRKVAELGADGFQVYCTGGAMAPETMDAAARRKYRKLVESLGLQISALCGDEGKGFLNPKTNPDVIARCRKFVDLAVDLGTKVITTHIGWLPHDRNAPEWKIGVAAVGEAAAYAEKKGVTFATETGPEPAEELLDFLQRVPCRGIGVNYDPANLVMNGFDHLGGVGVLARYIVHTHAKDGVREGGKGREVPLGKGGVDFPKYLKALEAAGYKGYLTIEREVGENPVADVAEAVKFLRTF